MKRRAARFLRRISSRADCTALTTKPQGAATAACTSQVHPGSRLIAGVVALVGNAVKVAVFAGTAGDVALVRDSVPLYVVACSALDIADLA